MRKPAYVYERRPFFRLKTREQDILELAGFSHNRRNHGRDGARIFYSGIFSLPIPIGVRHPSAILIRRPYGRFGNQYFQLLYAVSLARRLKIKVVLAPGNTVFPQDFSPLKVNGIRIITDPESVDWGEEKRAPKLSMKAPSFHVSYNTFFAGGAGELEVPLSTKETDVAIEMLRSKWDQPVVSPLATDQLVIHLRSGDVFSREPNPHYGQPPLAFYQKILELGEWSRVTLVKQDNHHPLEELISKTVKDAGLVLEVQSGTFEEDVAFLRSATVIVASRGTFVPAVAGLSPCVQRIFSFGASPVTHSSTRIVKIVDAAGEYWRSVCERNWVNSPEQLSLMKTYPKKNLRLLQEPIS